jgi:hypothetical protein
MKSGVAFFRSHTGTASGLWLTALGILVQAFTGAKGYPRVPPGIIILAVVGALVYLTRQFRWASITGVALAALISIGVFTTHGTAERLSHPTDVGPFVGTVVQLIGLVVALVVGIRCTTTAYLSRGSTVPELRGR